MKVDKNPQEIGVNFTSFLLTNFNPVSGEFIPRSTGDMIATGIEEFGHSQQEWYFEQNLSSIPGSTSGFESNIWGNSYELQVKLYILYNHCIGNIQLSNRGISDLKDHICNTTFYGITADTPLPNTTAAD